jgi:hypothetical protein
MHAFDAIFIGLDFQAGPGPCCPHLSFRYCQPVGRQAERRSIML